MYVGEWREDERLGLGICQYPNGGDVVIADWNEDGWDIGTRMSDEEFGLCDEESQGDILSFRLLILPTP